MLFGISIENIHTIHSLCLLLKTQNRCLAKKNEKNNINTKVSLVPRPTSNRSSDTSCKECGESVGMQLEVVRNMNTIKLK